MIDWSKRPTRHHVWIEPVPASDAQRGGWALPMLTAYRLVSGEHPVLPKGWDDILYTVHRPTLTDLITSRFKTHEHVYYEADMTLITEGQPCVGAVCRSCGRADLFADIVHAMANGRVVRPDLQTELPL